MAVVRTINERRILGDIDLCLLGHWGALNIRGRESSTDARERTGRWTIVNWSLILPPFSQFLLMHKSLESTFWQGKFFKRQIFCNSKALWFTQKQFISVASKKGHRPTICDLHCGWGAQNLWYLPRYRSYRSYRSYRRSSLSFLFHIYTADLNGKHVSWPVFTSLNTWEWDQTL